MVITPMGQCPQPRSSRLDPCPRGRTAIAVQADGKIVQSGIAFDDISVVRAIVRYESNGRIDAGFGTDGRALGTLAIGFGEEINALDLDGMGLYAAECSTRRQNFGRYLLEATAGVVVLESDVNPAPGGQHTTLTARVGGAYADGLVRFFDNGEVIPGCGDVVLVAGGVTQATAKCSTSFPTGDHLITAAYLGNLTNSPNTSAVLVQSVGRAANTPAVEYPQCRCRRLLRHDGSG